MRLNPVIAAAMLLVASGLYGQAPRKQMAPKASTTGKLKVPERDLADIGVTSRSLATSKNLAGAPGLICWEAVLNRVVPPGHEPAGSAPTTLPKDAFGERDHPLWVYSVRLTRFWGGLATRKAFGDEYETYLRVKEVPQISIDRGVTWVNGEKGEAGAWRFVLPSNLLELLPADGQFTPVEFKAFGIEKGISVVNNGIGGPRAPYRGLIYRSPVIALAVGRNELVGLVKYPGTEFVIPLHGMRLGKGWLAASTEQRAVWADCFGTTDSDVTRPGLHKILSPIRSWWQFTDSRVAMGIAGQGGFDPGSGTDVLSQWEAGLQWETRGAVDLPELAEAYKAHLSQAVWTQTDEESSFSREAEAAYAKTHLPVHILGTTQVKDHFSDRAFTLKKTEGALAGVMKRLNDIGIKTVFVSGK